MYIILQLKLKNTQFYRELNWIENYFVSGSASGERLHAALSVIPKYHIRGKHHNYNNKITPSFARGRVGSAAMNLGLGQIIHICAKSKELQIKR